MLVASVRDQHRRHFVANVPVGQTEMDRFAGSVLSICCAFAAGCVENTAPQAETGKTGTPIEAQSKVVRNHVVESREREPDQAGLRDGLRKLTHGMEAEAVFDRLGQPDLCGNVNAFGGAYLHARHFLDGHRWL